jgi:rhamnulokinase
LADALAFSLCGEKYTDFTYSFDCGIGNLEGKWNENLTRFLKVGSDILPKILPCGETVGYFTQSSGNKVAVINTALHDTASAYYALRLMADGELCMNAGTWFSVGVADERPILTPESKEFGVENIALPDETFIHGHTFLGAWFLQTFQKEKGGISYSVMSAEAQNEKGEFISADVSDMSRYQGENGLTESIRKDMKNSGIENPNDYQVLRSIYEGLANAVASAVKKIETISNKKFTKIFMSGGVTQDSFLCSLIEEKTQTKIVPCMKEASVVGNLLLQLQGLKLVNSVEECQTLMKNLEEKE